MCTAVLIGWDPSTPSTPRIWANIRGRYWSVKIDDISLWLPGRTACERIRRGERLMSDYKRRRAWRWIQSEGRLGNEYKVVFGMIKEKNENDLKVNKKRRSARCLINKNDELQSDENKNWRTAQHWIQYKTKDCTAQQWLNRKDGRPVFKACETSELLKLIKEEERRVY